jgi:hypothetical protein
VRNEKRADSKVRRIYSFVFLQKNLRLRPESNDAFAGCLPQYPNLQGDFNIDSKGLQAVFDTARHIHPTYSVSPADFYFSYRCRLPLRRDGSSVLVSGGLPVVGRKDGVVMVERGSLSDKLEADGRLRGRRHAAAIVRVMREQRCDDFYIAFERGTAERRLSAIIPAIHVCTMFKQHLRGLNVAVVTREHEQ